MPPDPSLRNRMQRYLSSPRLPLIAALVGCALAFPALRGTIEVDDLVHRAILLGHWPTQSVFLDLFAFMPTSEPARASFFSFGFNPWWTDPQLSVALFRPVSAATHALDYALWPDQFVLQHIHSLVWYALGIGVAAKLYRTIADVPEIAGLATLLFAVEDAHGITAAWLANRNALVALVFAGLAIWLHVRWRKDHKHRLLVAALALLFVGLLGAEAAIAAIAYIAAYQMTLDRGTWTRRLAALLPYLGVVVVWRVIYSTLGYGVSGSGLYIDPGEDMLGFLQAVAIRLPVLMLSQWTQVPVDLWMAMPTALQLGLCGAGLIVCVGLVWLLLPTLRANARSRFWVLGMVFSAVPVCAAFPMDRLLLFMGIGAFGLIANLAHELGIFGSNAAPGARVRRFVVAALLVVHLPLAAAAFPLRTMTMMIFGDITNVAATVLPTDAAVPQQTFVFINGMDVMTFYFPLTRSLAGAPIPKRTCLLASITADNAVERLDDRTLLIRPRRGFLALDGDQLLRNASTKFSVGQTIQRPELVATIVETTDDGRPAAVRFEFKEELEHTSLQWFVWKNGELLRFVLPKVGERVEVPSTRFDIWIGRDRPVRILDLD